MHNAIFLVVDDSRLIRDMIFDFVSSTFGTNMIYRAANGERALEILKKTDVDIIISDFYMPVMDGLEFLASVRKLPKKANTPFIMLTSNSEKEAIVKAIDYGVSQYLVKPFKVKDLEEKITVLLNATFKRNHDRHSCLPEHEAAIVVNKCTVHAEVINISELGALLRVQDVSRFVLCETYGFSLAIPELEKGENVEIKYLPVIPIRMNVEGCFVATSDNHKNSVGGEAQNENGLGGSSQNFLVAVHFKLIGLSTEDQNSLDFLIKWLSDRQAELIDDK